MGSSTKGSCASSSTSRSRIIRICVEQARGRLKIVPGVGSNATEETIHNVRRLEGLGVDGALVITPYYNKPSQTGLVAHFRAVAAECPVPIIMYNVPARTGVNLLPETVAALADIPGIAAIKEASGNLVQASWIHKLCGESIAVLCGEDALTYPMLCLGATGVISVLGNIAPQPMRAMMAAHSAGDAREALRWHLQLLPLAEALFLETNPMPVKEAMNRLGFEVGPARLPLVAMKPETARKLHHVLDDFGLERAHA
jgi:4-hydroxy-tetrahydrodipicolinate synthase